jgi:hypothetical protein
MDPRPKTRAYKFYNHGPAIPSGGLILATTCLNYRTT